MTREKNPPDDDAQRRAAAGRTERLSSPLVPGVPGIRLPAVPARLVPQEPELEPTRPDLPRRPPVPPPIPSLLPAPELEQTPPSARIEPVHRSREHQRTLVGPAAPPARGAAPAPPGGPPVASTPLPGAPAGDRPVTPPPPPRSLSPSPESGAAKLSVELGGTRVDFRTRNPTALWWLLAGALGFGGGAGGAALVHHAEPPPAPAVDVVADPCPPGQPATARSPLCLRLQAAEGTVNSMAWDVDDLKKRLAREHDAREQLEGDVSELRKNLPHIEGMSKK